MLPETTMSAQTETVCEVDGCDEPAPAVEVGELTLALCPVHEASFEAGWHREMHETCLDGSDGSAPRGRLV
jgi:hypothetical protein